MRCGDVAGCAVLELGAGRGAPALGARGRGATEARLADSAPAALAAIHKNITKLRLDNVRAVRRDYLSILKDAAKKRHRYDLIFVDPPYRMQRVIEPELARWLPRVAAPGARVIVESGSREEASLPLELAADKVYGDTRVRIFLVPEADLAAAESKTSTDQIPEDSG